CPLVFGTLGEMFCERAGILNLGIEGVMLISALTGFAVAYATGSPYIALLAAMLVGAIFSALMGVLTVALGLNQHVSGLGITMLCAGLAFFTYRLIFGQPASPITIPAFDEVAIPVLSRIPVLGPAIFDQFVIVYVAIIAIPLAAFVLNHTPWGLSLRMVGENPHAADAAGVSVARVRFQALAIGGALMGIGGAFLSLAIVQSF